MLDCKDVGYIVGIVGSTIVTFLSLRHHLRSLLEIKSKNPIRANLHSTLFTMSYN